MATGTKSSFARPLPSRKAPPRTTGTVDDSKGVWTSLLESVSGGKKLPDKTLLVLGGNSKSQNDLLDAIAPTPSMTSGRRMRDRPPRKKAPIANHYALGYTYQDVIGADQDDILARLSIYMLADTRPVFSPLLKPLFTPKTIPDMLLVILLDWQEPWNWMRQLKQRIRLVRSVLDELDDDCGKVMQDNMKAWRERKRGPAAEDIQSKFGEPSVSFPIGPGEWDEPLGVPLCCVCHNAEKTVMLDTEYGWKDKEFDAVMQFLRTVNLKHGASLIYSAESDPGSLQALIRASLDIHSLLQKSTLKRNVTDRDKVLIPPNWDTWGNIRAQDDDFPVEEISNAWSTEIKEPLLVGKMEDVDVDNTGGQGEGDSGVDDGTITWMYRRFIRTPDRLGLSTTTRPDKHQEQFVECPSHQQFLAEHAPKLEEYQRRHEAEKQAKPARKLPSHHAANAGVSQVSEHLAPMQLKVGGVSVDAEAAILALQKRTAQRDAEGACPQALPIPDGKSEEEKRLAFFAGLKVEGVRE